MTAVAFAAVDVPFGPGEEVVRSDWIVGVLVGLQQRGFSSAEVPGGGVEFSDPRTGCSVFVQSVALAEHERQGDDRLISDSLLAALVFGPDGYESQVREVNMRAQDSPMWQRAGEDDKVATVDVRVLVLTAGEAGRTAVLAARGFGALGQGNLFAIDCPDGSSATDVFRDIVETDVRFSVHPPQDH